MFQFILKPFHIIKDVIKELYQLFKDLIDKNSPKRVNAFINILTVLVFFICILAFTFATIFSERSYVAEIGIFTSALTGLCGYNYTIAKKMPNTANQELNSDIKERN